MQCETQQPDGKKLTSPGGSIPCKGLSTLSMYVYFEAMRVLRRHGTIGWESGLACLNVTER